MIKKVISGGQTGIDRLGLEIAKELGIETGGTAPPNFYTENGCDESLKNFGLKTIEQNCKGNQFYQARTAKNVFDSNGTVYFKTNSDSAGFICTKNYAKKYKKPFIVNPSLSEFIQWIDKNNISVLNVAGNRGSKLNNSLRQFAENVLRLGLVSKPSQLKLDL